MNSRQRFILIVLYAIWIPFLILLFSFSLVSLSHPVEFFGEIEFPWIMAIVMIASIVIMLSCGGSFLSDDDDLRKYPLLILIVSG